MKRFSTGLLFIAMFVCLLFTNIYTAQADQRDYYTLTNNAIQLVNIEAISSAKVINGFLLDPPNYYHSLAEVLECMGNQYPNHYIQNGMYDYMNYNHNQVIADLQAMQNPPNGYGDAYNIIVQMSIIANNLHQNAIQSDPYLINFNMPRYLFVAQVSKWKADYQSLAYQLHIEYPGLYYEDTLQTRISSHYPLTKSEGLTD